MEKKIKKPPKNVGEWFELIADPGQRKTLTDVARITTFAENSIWMLWRKYDPVSPQDIIDLFKNHDETGKWNKLPAPDYVLSKCKEGPTPTKIAKRLCPGLMSYVYDAIANNVSKLYRKHRFSFLTYQERLPISKHLRIRFREKAIKILRSKEKEEWFEVELSLQQNEKLRLGIKTVGKSGFTMKWLDDLAKSGESPSGGTISQKKRNGKKKWQICISRERFDGERAKGSAPILDRFLLCWAPPDQDVFVKCEVRPANGRPWVSVMESNDLIRIKYRSQQLRQTMGRNYNQSVGNAAHGHGRQRAIEGKYGFAGRYENRIKDWIENRSRWLVNLAIKSKCSMIKYENLVNRDSSLLRLGEFPYYRLQQRIKDKCKDAGIKFQLIDSFEDIEKMLTAELQ